jgi:DNA repair protein RadC
MQIHAAIRQSAILPKEGFPVPLTDWPTTERPRERLLRDGAAALSDGELLAAFLRTGTAGRDALDVARDALVAFDGLGGVLAASYADFCAVDGLGPARFAQLQAVQEIVRRSLRQTMRSEPIFTSPASVRDYLRLTIGARPHEVFLVLFLDARHRLLAAEELFRGTLSQTSVHPREVVKRALAVNAAAVVFAHNHPSGVAQPSEADEHLTIALRNALALVDIRTLDHFIVAGPDVYAFSEHGRL